MICKGTVLKIKDTSVIVMTEESEFREIKKLPSMFVGQLVDISEKDLIKSGKKSYIRFISLSAALFIIALATVFYFIKPAPTSGVYAYIDVDVNPSIEFMIDSKSKVIDINYINDDAEKLFKDKELYHLSIDNAIRKVIQICKADGFIKANRTNVILISASLNSTNQSVMEKGKKEDMELNQLLASLKRIEEEDKQKYKIVARVIQISPDVRLMAVKNKTSSGRQALALKAKEIGLNLPIQDIKKSPISEIFKKMADYLEDDSKNNTHAQNGSRTLSDQTGKKNDTYAMNNPNTQTPEPTANTVSGKKGTKPDTNVDKDKNLKSDKRTGDLTVNEVIIDYSTEEPIWPTISVKPLPTPVSPTEVPGIKPDNIPFTNTPVNIVPTPVPTVIPTPVPTPVSQIAYSPNTPVPYHGNDIFTPTAVPVPVPTVGPLPTHNPDTRVTATPTEKPQYSPTSVPTLEVVLSVNANVSPPDFSGRDLPKPPMVEFRLTCSSDNVSGKFEIQVINQPRGYEHKMPPIGVMQMEAGKPCVLRMPQPPGSYQVVAVSKFNSTGFILQSNVVSYKVEGDEWRPAPDSDPDPDHRDRPTPDNPWPRR